MEVTYNMAVPCWLKGGFIAVAYATVFLFIKRTCDFEWCFADIFLPFVYKPILILDFFLTDSQILFLGENIFITILCIWFIIGAVLGSAYSWIKVKARNSNIEIRNNI